MSVVLTTIGKTKDPSTQHIIFKKKPENSFVVVYSYSYIIFSILYTLAYYYNMAVGRNKIKSGIFFLNRAR